MHISDGVFIMSIGRSTQRPLSQICIYAKKKKKGRAAAAEKKIRFFNPWQERNINAPHCVRLLRKLLTREITFKRIYFF